MLVYRCALIGRFLSRSLFQCPRPQVVIQASPQHSSHVNINQSSSVSDKQLVYSYSIKIIPKRKAEYVIQKLRSLSKKFDTIDELKAAVDEACQGQVSLESFGYVEPGHGAKGKQRWLACNEDLEDLYHVYEGKKEILLWCNACDQPPPKRTRSVDLEQEVEGQRPAKSSRYDKFTDKMTEVESIEAKLREKHAQSTYSEHQLRSWAHLIQMKKHTSYDKPPDKPFWRTAQQKNVASGNPTASVTMCDIETSSRRDSPGKRINMRGKCMEQLMQLHKLFENNVITQEQYEEMKLDIMGEVKKL